MSNKIGETKLVSQSRPDFTKGMMGTKSGMATTTKYTKGKDPMPADPATSTAAFNPMHSPASKYGLGGDGKN